MSHSTVTVHFRDKTFTVTNVTNNFSGLEESTVDSDEEDIFSVNTEVITSVDDGHTVLVS